MEDFTVTIRRAFIFPRKNVIFCKPILKFPQPYPYDFLLFSSLFSSLSLSLSLLDLLISLPLFPLNLLFFFLPFQFPCTISVHARIHTLGLIFSISPHNLYSYTVIII